MSKKLFIVADDYGVHDLIDIGIHKCIDENVVDCVDIIVTHKSSKNRIKTLINKYPSKIESGKLKIGLHLNVNVGSPAYVPTSVDMQDPHFKDYWRFITKRARVGNQVIDVFRHGKVDKFVENLVNLESHYLDFLNKEMWAQYNRMCKILTELFGEGKKPDHISSHNGVFQGSQPIYENYSTLCKSEGIQMRCPALLTFDPAIGANWQKDPKQKLLPIAMIKLATKLPGQANRKRREGAKIILNWVKNGQSSAFQADLADGLISTDYSIEHFFRNGKNIHLNSILTKLRDHSYELIVHPLTYIDIDDRHGLPFGIKKTKKIIRDRKDEMEVLNSGLVQTWRASQVDGIL